MLRPHDSEPRSASDVPSTQCCVGVQSHAGGGATKSRTSAAPSGSVVRKARHSGSAGFTVGVRIYGRADDFAAPCTEISGPASRRV